MRKFFQRLSVISVTLLVVMAIIGGWAYYWCETLIVDRSFFTHSPCPPPCFYGIVPGLTTRQEAILILENNRYIGSKNIEIGTTSVARGGLSWSWRCGGTRQSVLAWENDIVSEIIIFPKTKITVEQILMQYGEPIGVHVFPGGVPEHWYVMFRMHYPDKGLEFLGKTAKYSDLLLPSSEIIGLEYFAPKTLEERLEQKYSYDVRMKVKIYSWKGYGSLYNLYP